MSVDRPQFFDFSSGPLPPLHSETERRLSYAVSSPNMHVHLSDEARTQYGRSLRKLGCTEEDIKRAQEELGSGALEPRRLDVLYQSIRGARTLTGNLGIETQIGIPISSDVT